MLPLLLSILFGVIGFIILFVSKTNAEKKDENQGSDSDLMPEDVPALSSKPLDITTTSQPLPESNEGEIPSVAVNQHHFTAQSTPPVHQVCQKEENRKPSNDEEDKVGLQPEPVEEVVKHLCDQVQDKSSPSESSTENRKPSNNKIQPEPVEEVVKHLCDQARDKSSPSESSTENRKPSNDEEDKVGLQPEPVEEVAKRLCDQVQEKSSPSESSTEANVFQVPLKEEQINISGCRRFIFGKDCVKTNRTIMVMGATGAGKSTLIDGMINYILGVRRNDNYRFKLVREVKNDSQAVSQTSEVTVYKLNYQDGFQINHSLTIIDTPGFGDTRGIKRDIEITEQIRNLFSSNSGIFELDAVCFVVQAALARLTPSQKYVFDSVLSIFGKDIAENIRVLVTFADGKRPPVLEAITASGVPCPEEKGVPLHFKFNNSALFSNSQSQTEDDEDGGDFDEMFWKMGQKSMERFFVALMKIPTKSLTLTKQVLTERKQLENLVENLQKQVRVGLSKLEEIKQTSEILQTHQAEINRNANFEFEVKVIEPHQILKKENTFNTNCQQCNYTCHEICGIPNDADKKGCLAMDQNGYCEVCPNKCIWSVHFNQKYKWEYKEVTKKQTIAELKSRYEVAKGEKNTAEMMLTKLEDEYDGVQVEMTMMMDRSSECLNKLKEIALKPDPLSTPDYIDMLIEAEKSEAKPGWKDRVEALMGMKEKAETVAKVGRNESLLQKEERKTAKKSFLTKMLHNLPTVPNLFKRANAE